MNIWKNRDWSPMLLKEISEPFNSKDYFFEIKFDGIRAIVFASPNSISIQSRNKKDLTQLFPELEEIKNLVSKNTIFDGEIVSLDKGKPSFAKVQNRLHIKNAHKISQEANENSVCFIVFDILYENKTLTDLPLEKRLEYLSKYPDTNVFIKSHVFENEGIKLFKEIKKKKLEGIVAKKKDGLYHINKRTDDFIKIKNIKREEFYILGYIKNKNSTLSLILGEKKNQKFNYVGKVTISNRTEVYKKVLKIKQVNQYIEEKIDNGLFIKPNIMCHIEFLEKTKTGHLRHAVYKGVKNE